MIQNVAITKQGTEADNYPTRTLFSSNTAWELNGANLIVYKNGTLINRDDDYSIVDNNTIELTTNAENSDNITMVVTKFISDDVNIAGIDRVVKKVENKAQTSLDKKTFEEVVPSHFIIHSDEVWSSDISPNPAEAISLGIAFSYVYLELIEDLSVSNEKGWFASSNGDMSGRITDWIPPKFGQNYVIKLYDNNNVQIPSSASMNWKWDYSAGYLFVEHNHTYQTPFKISAYQYTGNYGGEGGGGASHWKTPILTEGSLPTYGNVDGDIRLVLDSNILYRWNNSQLRWERTAYASQRFKDPVDDVGDLPTVDNIDGDFRLVLNENEVYRWNASQNEWQPVYYKHVHDDIYYDKPTIDDMLTTLFEENHDHHTVYYTKDEVDSMVRWRPPVDTANDLPPYTENRDGDIILTLDTKTIWRFDYYAAPQGVWTPIITAQLYWLEPIDTFANLPATGNTVGFVHLVLDEKIAYWWNGVAWEELTGGTAEHNHDERYYLKSEIFWRQPVADYSSLPLVDNTNGEIRLTLDNNNVYRWDGNDWILISASPRWREPVELPENLPTNGNTDGDVRIVKSTSSIYQWDEGTTMWKNLISQAHDHDDRYYTQTQLDAGELNTLYYTHTQVNAFFNTSTGHDHDGFDSKKIDWSNIDNMPHFYWQNPVATAANLPPTGNSTGDARIVLDEAKVYYWDGAQWSAITGGTGGIPDHNHDERYYTEPEMDTIISDMELWVTNQLALKSDVGHIHDDRYYTETEIDDEFNARFDTVTGHDHDGANSKRISYYDLIDVPPISEHEHDDLYYRKTQLQTSGESLVHWDNVTDKPDIANGHWKSPVQTYGDLPMTGNDLYDIRMVLDDSDIYEWDGAQWVFVGHWANQYVVYWREPVDEFGDLPLSSNVNGDVRLVMNENVIYRWDSARQSWIIISTSYSKLQVYLNGLLISEDEEYIRIKEKAIKLLFSIQAGSKITMILQGDYYLRQDFTAYVGQEVFEIINRYHRQDWRYSVGKTIFDLDIPYVIGGRQLIVWFNGDLQRVDDDYLETSTTSFTLLTPMNINDHVTAIIMEQESGVGEYIREDQYATAGQEVFSLANFYPVGTERLLVYYNGVLQKVNSDYIEESNSTIRMLNDPANAGEHFCFIILGASITGGGGCCNGKDIIIGPAPDGTYLDGLLEFYEVTKLNTAIDEINEALLSVAPDPPDNFHGHDLEISGISLYSGYESDNNINYEGLPGDFHNYLTEDNSFYLYTPNTSSFANADKGTIQLFINGVEVDNFRLYAAFVEANEDSNQTAISYGIQANGAREDEGVSGTDGAIRNSANGYLSVMSVGKYNDFKKWQKGRVRVNITVALLRQGYNYIYLKHDLTENDCISNHFKMFYDTANSRPYLDTVITLSEETINSVKYVSGVRYYSIGDQFRTVFSAFRVFNNTYSQIPVKFDMPGLQQQDIEYDHSSATGYQTPPRIGDFFDFNGVIELDEFNEYSIDARLTVSTFDPFGAGEEDMSASQSILVNTFTNGSTDLIEHFRDEVYRLPASNYDSLPPGRTGFWDSQALLVGGQALLFDQKLKYANINFTPYKPTQTADYSAFAGAQSYFRSFYKQLAKNSGTFTIDGIVANDLTSNNILIDIKLPTQTGWLSLNKPYDVGVFTGIDGDGCLLNSSGNQFTYSSGTFSTANSGYMIIVRITLPDATAPEISYMELGW